jgi:hypothetical protein
VPPLPPSVPPLSDAPVPALAPPLLAPPLLAPPVPLLEPPALEPPVLAPPVAEAWPPVLELASFPSSSEVHDNIKAPKTIATLPLMLDAPSSRARTVTHASSHAPERTGV